MGYRTTFTGEIGITPPIPVSAVAGNRFLDDTGTNHLCLILDADEREVTGIGAWSPEPTNHGDEAADEFRELVASLPPGRTFTGRIRAEGEDWDDQWAMTVEDDTPVVHHVITVWPDEDPIALQLTRAQARIAAATEAARAGGPGVARAVLAALGEPTIPRP